MDCMIPFRRRAPGSSTAALARSPNSLLDRLISDHFGDSWFVVPNGPQESNWLPAVELEETEAQITVHVELPGIDAKEVDLQLHDDVLVISGKKETRSKGSQGGRTWSERRFGSFRRELELPATVAADSVRATCEKGVLTITMQKSKSAGGRKIAVESK